MVNKKRPTRLRYHTKLSASGTGTLDSDRVQRGERIACQSIAFRNRTGTRGTLTLSLKDGDVLTIFADQAAPTANRWWYYPYTQVIKEGEQIRASQASCSASDELDLHIIGYIIYESSGEGA